MTINPDLMAYQDGGSGPQSDNYDSDPGFISGSAAR